MQLSIGARRRHSAGPRPIPGHGPHRYRCLVFTLDKPIPDGADRSKALLKQRAGHVLSRGTLTEASRPVRP